MSINSLAGGPTWAHKPHERPKNPSLWWLIVFPTIHRYNHACRATHQWVLVAVRMNPKRDAEVPGVDSRRQPVVTLTVPKEQTEKHMLPLSCGFHSRLWPKAGWKRLRKMRTLQTFLEAAQLVLERAQLSKLCVKALVCANPYIWDWRSSSCPSRS